MRISSLSCPAEVAQLRLVCSGYVQDEWRAWQQRTGKATVLKMALTPFLCAPSPSGPQGLLPLSKPSRPRASVALNPTGLPDLTSMGQEIPYPTLQAFQTKLSRPGSYLTRPIHSARSIAHQSQPVRTGRGPRPTTGQSSCRQCIHRGGMQGSDPWVPAQPWDTAGSGWGGGWGGEMEPSAHSNLSCEARASSAPLQQAAHTQQASLIQARAHIIQARTLQASLIQAQASLIQARASLCQGKTLGCFPVL